MIYTYYTNDLYKALAGKLQRSLGRYNLPCTVDAVVDWGSPLINKQYKATYLLGKLESTTEDVIWMDADTEVVKDPGLFRNPPVGDVGLFKCGEVFWSTVMVLRNTEATKAFVRAWIQGHVQVPVSSDQNIKGAIESSGVKYWQLPPSYVWYERTFRLVYVGNTAVINHLCVSTR